jgi:general stress protein 26
MNFNSIGGYMKVCQKYIRLHDKIKNIRTAMLTLADQDGCLYSLPVNTLMTECEGHMWFFIKISMEMENDLAHHNCVNISYSDSAHSLFVSITGEGEVIRDIGQLNELWKPVFCEWFPKGLGDAELALLRVNMMKAEYWDGTAAKMKNLWDFTEAFAIEKQNQNIDE